MERMTVKRDDGRWTLANNDSARPMEQMEKIPFAIALLAAYEDTGLTPEEIRCLLQTDTGGLYKKLPCREGDPVWWINVAWLPGNGPMFYKIDSGKFRFAMLDWQNPIYTSQADAEAALAEMASAQKGGRGK